MIRLTRIRTKHGLPSDFTGEGLLRKHEDLVIRVFAGRATPPVQWTSSKWKRAKDRLKGESHGKCAYCEAPTSVVAHGDVEHFRPKSAYWWLAYDVDNYVFACQLCNQVYKGDHFPISGFGLAAPTLPDLPPAGAALTDLARQLLRDVTLTTDEQLVDLWGSEEADLVHPYLEDPSDLFIYEEDDSNREVWIRSGSSPRAQRAQAASHTYLGINRDELRRGRYDHLEILRTFKLAFEEERISEQTRSNILERFRKMSDTPYPFAGLHRYYLRKWGIL